MMKIAVSKWGQATYTESIQNESSSCGILWVMAFVLAKRA